MTDLQPDDERLPDNLTDPLGDPALEVDAGSPQDVGEPNDDVVRAEQEEGR